MDEAPIDSCRTKTGFVDPDTFVTHCEILQADGRRAPVPRLNDTTGKSFIDTKGSLEGTTEHVLKLAIEFDLSRVRHRRLARRASADLREHSPVSGP